MRLAGLIFHPNCTHYQRVAKNCNPAPFLIPSLEVNYTRLSPEGITWTTSHGHYILKFSQRLPLETLAKEIVD
jgi:hypothetical protein